MHDNMHVHTYIIIKYYIINCTCRELPLRPRQPTPSSTSSAIEMQGITDGYDSYIPTTETNFNEVNM